MSNNGNNGSLPTGKAAVLEELRLTRDFGLYLDLLNEVKREYLIILCLKDTSEHGISGAAAEKIRRLGFSKYTTEPDMKYAGVLHNGSAICDIVLETNDTHGNFDGSIPGATLNISFEEKEGEIRINGRNESLNDKGINIVVYDLKNRKIVDASCCNASEGAPEFYHRNFYYSDEYIKSHIYMPESFMDSVTLPLRRSYFSTRILNVREVERGIFLPSKYISEIDEYGKEKDTYRTCGGICDEAFRFAAGHKLFNTRYNDGDERHISDSYSVPQEDIVYMDETVLYGGTLIEHPGHLIVECFADRLWWLAENADSDIKIAVEIIWGNGEMGELYNSFVMEFFDAYGIPRDRVIIIEKPTQFKKIIVPDQSSIPLNYCYPYEFTSAYIKPFEHIKKQLVPGKYKKIYLSKSKLYRSATVGEEYFVDFFEKKGFKVIHPEDHTIKEKAELMYGADEVVTIDGTNSLFTVFCKPTAKVTVLTRRLDFWDSPQQLINESLRIKDFFLVNISGNFLENFSGNTFFNYARGMTFTYVTKEFKKYVKYIYNEDIDITPEESLKERFYEYLVYFSEFYAKMPEYLCIANVKMKDVLRSMNEVFKGKKMDTGDRLYFTTDEFELKKLRRKLREEKETSSNKIMHLSEMAKEAINENTSLKQALAQLEAENRQLREKNAELTAYMAEISQLLDALEGEDGTRPEE